MDKPRTRIKTPIIVAITIFFIFILFVIPEVYSAGDPPFSKQKDIMQVDAFSATDEAFSPEVDDTQVKIKLENEKKEKDERKEILSSVIVEDTKTTTEELNNENSADTTDNVVTEEESTDYESTDAEITLEVETPEHQTNSEVENDGNIENIPNTTTLEVIPENLPVTNKFVPQGPYNSVDFSIYTPEEIEVLNIVLAKINENKNTDKKEEFIDIDSKLSMESYYRVASYFYVYYGQKRAVDETFDLINHSSFDMTTGEEVRKYMIRMRYDDIRTFERDLEQVKNKADEILSSFEAGSDEFILYQISEYLRTHITYTEGKYDITSALIDGECVCNGYALAFNMLANRAGIKSDMCIGELTGGSHAWNRVTLKDGSYSFYDITFYDTNNPDKQYINSLTPLHTSNYLINDYTECWFGQ